MSKVGRHFTQELRRKAVKLCGQPEAAVAQLARNLVLTGSLEMSSSKPRRSEMATKSEWRTHC